MLLYTISVPYNVKYKKDEGNNITFNLIFLNTILITIILKLNVIKKCHTIFKIRI